MFLVYLSRILIVVVFAYYVYITKIKAKKFLSKYIISIKEKDYFQAAEYLEQFNKEEAHSEAIVLQSYLSIMFENGDEIKSIMKLYPRKKLETPESLSYAIVCLLNNESEKAKSIISQLKLSEKILHRRWGHVFNGQALCAYHALENTINKNWEKAAYYFGQHKKNDHWEDESEAPGLWALWDYIDCCIAEGLGYQAHLQEISQKYQQDMKGKQVPKLIQRFERWEIS